MKEKTPPSPPPSGMLPEGFQWLMRGERLPVVPLYREIGPLKLEYFGSGTLVAYGNKNLLITAAHVVDHNGGNLMIIGNSTPVIPFERKRFRRNPIPPGFTRENDLVDFAVAELTYQEVLQIKDRQGYFISLGSECLPSSMNIYYMVGFSVEFNVADNKKMEITARATGVALDRCDEVLAHDRNRKANSALFVAGHYDPQGMESEARIIKKFNGLSGGPIFYGLGLRPLKFSRLAGIALEAHPHKNGRFRIIGLSTWGILGLLHEWYELPRPRLLTHRKPSDS